MPPEEEDEALWLSGEWVVMLAALSMCAYALVEGRSPVEVAGLALLTLPDLTSLFLFSNMSAGFLYKSKQDS